DSKIAQKVPVTEPQLEVWLADQLSDDASCSYNESFTLHMRGKVNESALKDAVRQIVNRHDGLRATFIHEGQVQKFAPKLDLNIPTMDLTTLSAAERDARWKQIISDDAHTPFRLVEGPMVRAQLVNMEPGYACLVFTAHHIVCDGSAAACGEGIQRRNLPDKNRSRCLQRHQETWGEAEVHALRHPACWLPDPVKPLEWSGRHRRRNSHCRAGASGRCGSGGTLRQLYSSARKADRRFHCRAVPREHEADGAGWLRAPELHLRPPGPEAADSARSQPVAVDRSAIQPGAGRRRYAIRWVRSRSRSQSKELRQLRYLPERG